MHFDKLQKRNFFRWRVSRRDVLVGLLLLVLSCPAAAEEKPQKTPVQGQPFVANLHLPAGKGPFPGVLLVGGSGGGIGWQDYMGEILAEKGFASLALAYFGMEGLPESLELIPIEYFQKGLDYLAAHEAVDAKRIGVIGVSKGGEVALLLASYDPRVRAVVAFAPSAVVFQSIAKGFPRTSSWTYKGKPLSFVPYVQMQSGETLADMYRRSLDQKDEVAEAAIPVENINGPILLISGKADTLWPSTYLGEMVMERLRAHAFPHRNQHVAYEDAGHLISSIRSDATRRGGTQEGNARAQRDGQLQTIDFLQKHLASR